MDLERINQRIEKLENANRRLKIAVSLTVLGIAALLLTAAVPKPSVCKSLKTRDLQIISSAGKPVAVLRSDRNDCGRLEIYDVRGKRRFIFASADDPFVYLQITDENGKTRCSMTASSDGSSIHVSDPNHNTRAEMGTSEHGDGFMQVLTKQGEALWSAP